MTDHAASRRDLGRAVPAPALVLGAVASVQFGAALARTLFGDVGPTGTVLLRSGWAALVLLLLWRPRLRHQAPRALAVAAAFGLSLAAMNLSFYEALARIPLGAAVTIEFVGPLAVALLGSRRPLDLLWVAFAVAGILALTSPGAGHLDGLGIALALAAGACWAAYILLSARTGRLFPGGGGLAIAMGVSALLLVPPAIAGARGNLLDPRVLASGAAVAMLSSAIPYSLELEALRRLPERVFGVLLSLEPAVAALAGFVVLGQVLNVRQVAGISLVVVASAGAARGAPVAAPPDSS